MPDKVDDDYCILLRKSIFREVWVDAAGEPHRKGKPAIIWSNGACAWYFHGVRHCTIGPAVVTNELESRYFINGKEYTEIEFNFWKEFA